MSGSPAAPIDAADLADPEFWADPHPVFRELRERTPVARRPDARNWIVTGYEQIRSLLRDPRIAVHPPRSPAREAHGQHPFVRARAKATVALSSFLHDRAPADHARLRRLVRPAFSPARSATRRARIQELTDGVLDRALARGRLDVVDELARPVALTTITELMGIPESSRLAFGDWARDLAQQMDLSNEPAHVERGILAAVAMMPRLRELIAGWHADPPTDDNLLWQLEQARESGSMTEEEVIGHGALLLFAGHLTSQHLIASGVLALIRHPDQWELLRARPELIHTTVEELVRYATPVPILGRQALEQVEIAGETIAPGDKLLLVAAAANRDPAVFTDPERLDIRRDPNPHLGFGQDAHYCLGAALGRLEAEVVIGTLVRRVPSLRVETETLDWEGTFVLRGLASLPVRVEAR